MLLFVQSFASTMTLEGNAMSYGHEKYNMATFMLFFLLITIEVVVVKVVTFEMERDEDSHPEEDGPVSRFFDRDDWETRSLGI